MFLEFKNLNLYVVCTSIANCDFRLPYAVCYKKTFPVAVDWQNTIQQVTSKDLQGIDYWYSSDTILCTMYTVFLPFLGGFNFISTVVG